MGILKKNSYERSSTLLVVICTLGKNHLLRTWTQFANSFHGLAQKYVTINE